MNILTFDVEEWFHILDNDSTRTEKQWGNFEVRIYDNMERIFRILEETNTTATFFIIGWIAKKYPDIVKHIAERYQIGCHTMNHQLVWQQSKKEFKEDVSSSIKLLEDISGKKVEVFRAPGFSIRESESWAFEILNELGIIYDCSIFPANHVHGGMPSFSIDAPAIIEYQGIKMKELPICFKTICGKHIIFSGGGYFRLLPYFLIKRWSLDSKDYLLSYIHPRDLDPGQPVIKDLTLKRQIRSYIGLKNAEKKLSKYLSDFDFIDIEKANKMIDWNRAQIIKL
jgi:peptidoglycan-N-acetylglucosamine deacetylase